MSADRLIDALWGERPPASGRTALQVRISQLRKALGPAGGQLLTRAPGYVLELDDDQLDLRRFERLVDEAETSPPAIAASRLRDALALWRAEPLADLAYETFAQPAIARLQELRRAAVERRIDADLALGRHSQVVAELETLVSEQPHRERLTEQLMLALYRSGRQADALDAYRGLRVRLAAELGLEPGSGLVALQSAILNHDPALGLPRRPAAAAPIPLPVPATAFVGRARELGEVTTLLQRSGTRLLTLTGAGGTGKTRLALRVAELGTGSYRDGVCFVGFAIIVEPDLIAPTISQALGLADQPGVEPRHRLIAWLRERQLLLVLDNLEQLAADTGVLGELLAACPSVTMLATSREPLRLAAEQQYEVPVLAAAEAVELLSTRAGAVAPGRSIDTQLAGAICERLDRLPLAIELAAARLRAFSPTEILGRLDGSLALLTGGPRDAPRRQRTLRATIDWSYGLLSREEQDLFARLGVFAGGCTLAAAQTVCHAGLDTLQSLVDRSLVRSDGERYWMLQTLRDYALERMLQTGEGEGLRRAHADWLIALLDAYGLPQPAWPDERSLAGVAPERENFSAALEWAAMSSQFETVARLAAPLVGVWVKTGRLYEAERWITLVRGHEDAYTGLLAAQVASAARALAWNRGDHVAAATLTHRALTLWREVGNLEAIGRETVSLGMVACDAGDFASARDAYETAIQFAREHALGDVLSVALTDLGDLEILHGNLEAARLLCEESRTHSIPGSDSAVISGINLAHIAMLERRPADAATLSREALEATLRAGSTLTVAWSAILAAWPLAEMGELERSARLLGSGLEFLDNAGAKRDWMDEAVETAVSNILRDHLDEPSTQALLAAGRKMPLEQTAREALNESPALADA